MVWANDEGLCMGYVETGIHVQLKSCADVETTWELNSTSGAISATSTSFTAPQCLYFEPHYPTPTSKLAVGLIDCDGSILQGWFIDSVPLQNETTTGAPEPAMNTTSGVPEPVETTTSGVPEPVSDTTTGVPGPVANTTTVPEPIETTTGVPDPNATTSAAPSPGAFSRIRSSVGKLPQLCVDLPGGDTSNGAVLWVWAADPGGATQQWSFEDGQLKYAADTSKCVDMLGGDSSNGNLIGLWDCYDGDNQQWGYDPDMHTIYLASSTASDATKCLQLGDPAEVHSSWAPGTQLKIWDCDGSVNQQWYVEDDAQPKLAVV